jgi:hypothetical protein
LDAVVAGTAGAITRGAAGAGSMEDADRGKRMGDRATSNPPTTAIPMKIIATCDP